VASLPSDTAAQHWSSAQRLQALFESHALSGVALHAWCREKGLFEHQLKQWRETFCRTTEPDRRESRAELRELKVKNEQLQRDLRRKDRTLAETAALLVLQKKFQALLEDKAPAAPGKRLVTMLQCISFAARCHFPWWFTRVAGWRVAIFAPSRRHSVPFRAPRAPTFTEPASLFFWG
jgi:transposase-like protein